MRSARRRNRSFVSIARPTGLARSTDDSVRPGLRLLTDAARPGDQRDREERVLDPEPIPRDDAVRARELLASQLGQAVAARDLQEPADVGRVVDMDRVAVR